MVFTFKMEQAKFTGNIVLKCIEIPDITAMVIMEPSRVVSKQKLHSDE